MAKFAIKVTQVLSETVIVDGVRTPQEALELARKFDQEIGIDPQEIENVGFGISDNMPTDRYALVITPDDVENEYNEEDDESDENNEEDE